MKSAIRTLQSAIPLAFVLCAGIGRRLRPLTLHYPKALLPLWGRPMVFYVLDALRRAGVRRFLVNLHAHPEIVQRALADYGKRHGVRFTFLLERKLLDTGGALRNARRILTEPFWLVNCDFFPEGFSFQKMERAHRRSGAIVTLAVRPKSPGEPYNPVGVDRRGR
ncbi:nucleotidyltransferase family protein, partial [bacterium]|nr:nucleotidyltransferase family protein [bacterium]